MRVRFIHSFIHNLMLILDILLKISVWKQLFIGKDGSSKSSTSIKSKSIQFFHLLACLLLLFLCVFTFYLFHLSFIVLYFSFLLLLLLWFMSLSIEHCIEIQSNTVNSNIAIGFTFRYKISLFRVRMLLASQ